MHKQLRRFQVKDLIKGILSSLGNLILLIILSYFLGRFGVPTPSVNQMIFLTILLGLLGFLRVATRGLPMTILISATISITEVTIAVWFFRTSEFIVQMERFTVYCDVSPLVYVIFCIILLSAAGRIVEDLDALLSSSI